MESLFQPWQNKANDILHKRAGGFATNPLQSHSTVSIKMSILIISIMGLANIIIIAIANISCFHTLYWPTYLLYFHHYPPQLKRAPKDLQMYAASKANDPLTWCKWCLNYTGWNLDFWTVIFYCFVSVINGKVEFVSRFLPDSLSYYIYCMIGDEIIILCHCQPWFMKTSCRPPLGNTLLRILRRDIPSLFKLSQLF